MLDRGIIKWTDIKFKLIASAHGDCDFFEHMFATTEDTQQNARTADLDRIELPGFGKKLHQCCTRSVVETNTSQDECRESHIFRRFAKIWTGLEKGSWWPSDTL